MQQRLRRFLRQPEKLAERKLTEKGLEVIAAIERYRFIPSSLLVRVVRGGQRNNYRHLQTLYHKGFINRFALPTLYGLPGEFVYYLDTLSSLRLLSDRGLINVTDEVERKRKQEIIRYNQQKAYHQLHKDQDQQGKLLYIQHELMIGRFRFMLEAACRKLAGQVDLEQWKQGPELWNRVEVPAIRENRETGRWQGLDKTEFLPHRPDAYFVLRFLTKPEGQQRSHFFMKQTETVKTPHALSSSCALTTISR